MRKSLLAAVVLALCGIVPLQAGSPNHAAGFEAGQVYQFGDLDNINLFNGNLTVRIPLGGRRTVAGSLSYGLELVYNSEIWDYTDVATRGVPNPTCCGNLPIPSQKSNAGLGWSVNPGRYFRPQWPPHDLGGAGYLSSDGALHDGAQIVPGGPFYTTDSTFMRSSPGKVEFPDGTYQTFDDNGWLSGIGDQYGNVIQVTIGFDDDLGAQYWRFHDEGGDQFVYFKHWNDAGSTPSTGGNRTLVNNYGSVIDHIVIKTAGGTDTYRFVYADRNGVVDANEIVGGQCGRVEGWDDTYKLPMLHKVILPDGSAYVMDYSLTSGPGEVACGSAGAGQLETLTLPTLGKIKWNYDAYTFPQKDCVDYSAQSIATGVSKRQFLDKDGVTDLGTWTYHTDFEGLSEVPCDRDPGGNQHAPVQLVETLTNTVITPRGDKEIHYFSAWNSTPLSSHGARGDEYAYPMSRLHADPIDATRFLQTAIFDCGTGTCPGTPTRSVYALFDNDSYTQSGATIHVDQNRRQKAERTIYEDGSYKDAEYDDWDGLGHFRVTTLTGSVGRGGETRVVTTNYNRPDPDVNPGGFDSGTYPEHHIPTGEKWVLGTYSSQTVSEGGIQTRSLFDFNPDTGFLRRSRVLKGAPLASHPLKLYTSTAVGPHDLVVQYSSDGKGDVESEEYYGGDRQSVGLDPLSTLDLQGLTPSYRIHHTYVLGTQATTWTDGAGFLSLDRTLDEGTGLMTASRDSAGVETLYFYDPMRRLKEQRPNFTIDPDGTGWTKYTYNNATSSSPANIVVEHLSPNGSLVGQEKVEYDSLGRVARNSRITPGSAWSVQETTYNLMGWRDSVSEYEAENAATRHRTYYRQYDAFGRPHVIHPDETTAPSNSDQHVHDQLIDYAGDSTTTKTIRVFTGSSEVAYPEISQLDLQGRLWKVKQHSGLDNAEVTTEYTYDAADRLVKVCADTSVSNCGQQRLSLFDNRGFMVSERHPEKSDGTLNPTVFFSDYDARGHSGERREGVENGKFDLKYTYDAAEHLVTVEQKQPNGSPQKILKRFFYAADNEPAGCTSACTNFSKGKLVENLRHNYHPLFQDGDYPVTQTFIYGGRDGRISEKITTLPTGQSFRSKYTYGDAGQLASTEYPLCKDQCAGVSWTSRTITGAFASAANQFLTRVSGDFNGQSVDYAKSISYHPNGLRNELVHGNLVTDATDFDRTTGMRRVGSITVSGFCAGPAVNAAEPHDATIASGAGATLTVTPPAGVASPQYQWYQGLSGDTSHPQGGGNGASFITPALLADTKYWVRVGDGNCSTDSRTATVVVRPCTDVTITQQPQDAVRNAGQTADLSITANGPSGSPVQITWFRGAVGDPASVEVGSGSTFTTEPLNTTTTFWARVTAGSCSVPSRLVTVRVCTIPVIVSQPRSQSAPVPGSGSVTLSTSISVTGVDLHFQWYESTSGSAVALSNATTPMLSMQFDGVNRGPRRFFVRVTDNACQLSVDSNTITMEVTDCIKLVASPGDVILFQGAMSFLLSVRVEGQGPFHYKWFHGIGDDAVELTNISPQEDSPEVYGGLIGQYDAFWCVITSEACPGLTVTTPKAYATLSGRCPLPPLTVTPTSAEVPTGGSATFIATVDWPRVAYQWYSGPSGDTRHPLTGQTHKTITLSTAGAYWLRVTDECGKATEDSPTLRLKVGSCDPVVIVGQPQSADIGSGESVTLRVNATSGLALSYVWYKVGSTIPLEPVSTSAITVHPDLTTSYYVHIVNSCSVADSLPATVHLKRCPTIAVASQPSGTQIVAGETTGANLTVAATSTGGALTYQWYVGETGDMSHEIVGEVFSTLHVLPSVTTSYWVRLHTASCTIDSDTAVVTVCVPPSFVTPGQPVTNEIRAGQSIALGSTVQGTDLHYAWHVDSPNSNIIAGTEWAVYVHPIDTTVYYLVVTGACGQPITSAAITVHVCATPVIDEQPHNVTVFSDKPAILSVAAHEPKNVPLTYQWEELGAGMVGSAATLTTAPITAPKQYVVHLTAGACTLDSNTVAVNVCALPETITTGTTQNVAVGQSVTLNCVFSPAGGNVFVWYAGPVGDFVHSSPVSYNSSPTFTFLASQPGTSTYWATIEHSDDGCVSHTNAYTVNVCIPAITQQPQAGGYDLVHPVPLSITAVGATSYQWYTGSTGDISHAVPGATTASTTVTPTTDTSYWCRATGSCGSVDSNAVLVTSCQQAAITVQPVGGGITRGQTLSIGVGATGTSLGYQWYQGLSGDTTNPVYGNTPGINVNPLNSTDYWVRVSGLCGPARNSNTAHVTVCTTPVINTQPVGTNVFSGRTATLTVAASEATTEPLHYQWFTAAGGAVGSDAPTFTTPPLTQPAQYYVHVTAAGCSIDSNVATIGICTLPEVINSGTTSNVAIGQTVTLSCVISPATGNTFVWYAGPVGDAVHSAQLSSNSSGTFSFNAAATSGGTYWAAVSRSDDGCASRTNAYTVNVCVPAITTQPAASTMITSGQSATLTVAANTSGITYQWYVGTSGTTTSPITGATGPSVTVGPTSNTNYWVKVTGTCGQSVNSNTAAITICQTPAITTQPAANSYIVRGYSVSLGVAATGDGLAYQWYQGTSGNTSTPLAATTPGMTVSPQNPTDYWVKVTGTCGSRNSNTAHVAVCTTPAINTQPAGTSIFSGGSATLTVSASEATGEALHYQWYRNGSTPVGTDSPTLNTGALTADTTFYVHITAASGTCSIDSATATVSMCPLPQTVTGAPSQNTTPGQTVRLQLGSMPGATAYMWYAGTSGNTAAPVTGWQAANYLDVSPGTTSSWWAQVQNGSCVSNTTTTTVNVCIPTITQQPASTTIPSGSATLTVASNLSGSTYQWYSGTSGTTTSPITGATNASVTVSPSSTPSYYWCRVSGSCGSANSNTATVTICSVPNITAQPVNATPVYRYASSGLSVTATGTSLTYQWYTGASGDTSHPVSGATSASYVATAYNSERYWVRVSGMCGTRDSNAAWISVIPQFIGQPVQTTYLSSGSRVTLSVNVYMNTYLHYAWCYDANGQTVPGSPDSPVWMTPDVTASNTYFCRVTSGIASAESYRAYVYLCDGGNSAAQPYATNAGGSCRYLWPNAGGNWDHIEWYQGQKGDTSYQIGNGNYLYTCSSVGTSVWYRVVGYDSNQGQSCYTDSPSLNVQ